jgi:hypothetical protein
MRNGEGTTRPVPHQGGDGPWARWMVIANGEGWVWKSQGIVPLRATAVLSQTAQTDPTQRDRHLQCIAEKGRRGWQKASGYNKRAKPRR